MQLLLWLILCYAHYTRSNFIEDYEQLTKEFLYPKNVNMVNLPLDLGVERTSGCLCRATQTKQAVVCFGNYECKKFPKMKIESDILRVRTTAIEAIYKGDLDAFYFLDVLEIEANHFLTHIESGVFRNMTKLTHLSISYSIALKTIEENMFEGLLNLRNLTMVNNGFTNILDITPAFSASRLPSLVGLDLSENSFDTIPENAFAPMEGTLLWRLDINLCRLDYIHEKSLLPFPHLRVLNIGENELNASIVGQLLNNTVHSRINLTHLDLAGMGFRKQVPKDILNIIAQSTIKVLLLARNQFEIIDDESFPVMQNIEILDLRRVFVISIGSEAFSRKKFPRLKVLLLGGNNLPGLHKQHISYPQIQLLDLSNNLGSAANPLYYEIGKFQFNQSTDLIVLNLSFNRVKSVLNYTFVGLTKVQILNLQNDTIYFIGPGTFKPLKSLKILNLANNPLEASQNLTSAMFEGLNKLQLLTLENCGIKHFNEEDNIFEMMPNLMHLILKNNQLYFITAEILKPLKLLRILDLSQNLLIAWWNPLFLSSGVKPTKVFLKNNKISHFSVSMIEDINYLFENANNCSVEIDLMENIFICDCSSMYRAYLWLEVNSSMPLKNYFSQSRFLCSSPDLWEDKRVAEYLLSIKSLNCLMYEKISNVMVLMWTAPSIVTIMLLAFILIGFYKYRVYVKYWIFLGKFALGRKISRKYAKNKDEKGYKYDAFISYSNDDRDFVSEMIDQLENDPPFLKLCVYERDFEIGAFISESIHSSINESRFVILLISDSFVKSQWCRWETQLAEYHRIFLEDGTIYDPLVLIRIGDIDNKYLTTTLKYLLKTKIYHTWDGNQPEEFWKKLRQTLLKK